MSDPLIGCQIKLRMYELGGRNLGKTFGTIVKRLHNPDQTFHDTFVVELHSPLNLYGAPIGEVYLVPSGSYAYQKGQDKMLDVLHKSVSASLSWKTQSGDWGIGGENATFAEAAKMTWFDSLLRKVR
jgi:hypothetical protein